MLRSRSVPSSAVFDGVGDDHLPVRGGREGIFAAAARNLAVSMSPGVVSVMIVADDPELAGIDRAVEHLLATSVGHAVVVGESACRSWSVSSTAKTPICTSSHLSPSMMSSPALPWIRSLPSPPRMMSPADEPPSVTAGAPSTACRPLISAMPSASSALPRIARRCRPGRAADGPPHRRSSP